MDRRALEPNLMPALLVLALAFLLGALAGCLLSGAVANGGSETLTAYLEGYLGAIREGTSVAPSVYALVWELLRWPLLAALFGFTALGAVAMPILFCVRGFLLAFAVGSFAKLLGGAGCRLAFLVFGLSGLIAIPVLFVLGVQGWTAARSMLAGGERISPVSRAYVLRYCVCAGGVALCVLLECFVAPPLLAGAAHFLNL